MDGFGPHMANMSNMGMFPGMFPPGAMPGIMGMPPGMMEADFGPMSQVLHWLPATPTTVQACRHSCTVGPSSTADKQLYFCRMG